MKKWILFILLTLFTAQSYAAQMDVDIDPSWTNATLNTDGSPYVNHAVHTFYLSLTPGGNEVGVFTLSDAPIPVITSHSIPITLTLADNVPQNVYVRMTHVNLDSEESSFSNEVVKGPFVASPLPTPNPSGSLSVAATITACEVGYVCSGGD